MMKKYKKNQEICNFYQEIGLDYLSCLFVNNIDLINNINLTNQHVSNTEKICKQVDIENNELSNKLKKINTLSDLQNFTNNFSYFPFVNLMEKIIFGIGQINKLMIIGDMPTKNDVMLGRPFTSEVGVLLTKMLNAIDIKIEECYMTNVLPHRHSVVNIIDEKNLLPDMEIYKMFLLKSISLVKPKVILLLGKLPVLVMFNINSIENAREQYLTYNYNNNSVPVIATYHPLNLLKSTKNKKFAWKDLQILKNKLIHAL